jgi:hypothetical protein
MADSARLEGVAGTSAAQKRGAGTVGGAQRTGPPRKASGSAPGGGAAPATVVSTGGGSSGGVGRHSAARAGAKELAARRQAPARPQNALFELPPAFEAAVARQAAVRGRHASWSPVHGTERGRARRGPPGCILVLYGARSLTALTAVVPVLPALRTANYSFSSACSAPRRSLSRCRPRCA